MNFKCSVLCFAYYIWTIVVPQTNGQVLPYLTASFKSGYCPTAPVESFNTIECTDDTGCPGIAKCCPTPKGNKCLVPTAQPPKYTSQPCGGLNEQWESCTTPCPASCEYSSPYDSYRQAYPYFSRNVLGGCSSCIAGCSCISGHLRERLQGASACVPAGAATCIGVVGQPTYPGSYPGAFPGSYPFDYYSRYAYPNGLRYPNLYWNTLWNRNGIAQVPPVAPFAPYGPYGPYAPVAVSGPVAPLAPVGPVGPIAPPVVPGYFGQRYPYYPENVLGQPPPPDTLYPYDKRSKDDKKDTKDTKEDKGLKELKAEKKEKDNKN